MPSYLSKFFEEGSKYRSEGSKVVDCEDILRALKDGGEVWEDVRVGLGRF